MSEFPSIEVKDAKRIWFITDTHLGVRNNSNEWIEIINDYFFKWFIPLVKEHYKPGDILLHLGDWYDSRQSVNLKVLNLGVEVAEELSKVFTDGIHILIGNHDIWGKNSNDVNSLKSIKWIPGITIHEEPCSVLLGDRRFFLMPWRKDHEAEVECLNAAQKHDYLCCHTDIRGLSFNKFVKIEDGVNIKDLQKFDRVYSGHIHYSQAVGNVKMLGSPYELTRSDMNNKKGITLLDLKTGKEAFFENTFSPRFQRLTFDDVLEMSIDEATTRFSNNFVDVMIDPRMALKAPLNIFTDSVTSPRKITFHPHDPNQAGLLSEHLQSVDTGNFSVLDFVEAFVDGLEYDDDTKERLVKSIKKLHSIATSENLENRV